MAKAVVSRLLSVHKEHEVLLKLETAGLGEDEAQAIVDSKKNTLASTLVEVVRALRDDKDILDKIKELLSSSKKSGTVPVGQYADEKVKSSYTYPPEYKGPKLIGEQVDRLAELFGLSLGYTSEYLEKILPTLTLPEGAEGWFAIPSVDALAARFFPEVEDVEERYARAVQLIFDKIAELRPFYNFRNGEIDSKHMRLHPRTLTAFKQIAETQKGDILIVPLQLGLRHRGKSIRLADEDIAVGTNEFGLDILSGVSVALVHPERFVRWEALHMDLPGTKWSLSGGGEFAYSAYLGFSVEKLEFDYGHLDDPDDNCGSASGFLVSVPS